MKKGQPIEEIDLALDFAIGRVIDLAEDAIVRGVDRQLGRADIQIVYVRRGTGIKHGAGVDAIVFLQRHERRDKSSLGLEPQPGDFKCLGVPSPIERDEVTAGAHQMEANVAIEPFIGEWLWCGVLALRSDEEEPLIGRSHPALTHRVGIVRGIG